MCFMFIFGGLTLMWVEDTLPRLFCVDSKQILHIFNFNKGMLDFEENTHDIYFYVNVHIMFFIDFFPS